MRAAVVRRAGPADLAIEIEEIEPPQPGPGEVRVRIAVSGVNPTDYKERTRQGPGDFPLKVPNQDGAGTIEAVGKGVDAARVGERVWVLFAAWQRQWGTAAELSVVPADHAVPLPEDASFELGAGLGIPALTAHRCLLADGPVDGATVLVAGGAGAVGHAAIELARRLGAAKVITTVSDDGEKSALAREAGAHEVVNYHAEDALERVRAAAPDGVDRIVEVDPGHNAELDLAVVAPHGAIAYYAGAAPLTFTPQAQLGKNLVVRSVLIYTIPRDALRHAVRDVSAAVEARALTTLPLHRFSLDQAAAAHDAVEAGVSGKVLIDVAD